MGTTNIELKRNKLALDEQLVRELTAIGIVENVTDLSRKLGKNDSYYFCMKNRGYSIHLGSLVFLAAKLSNELNASSSVRERAKLRSALDAVNETIQAKCRLREQELLTK